MSDASRDAVHGGPSGAAGGVIAPPAEPFMVGKLRDLANWGRKYSLWPYPFGTACCGIEYMSLLMARYDVSRFGAELVRFSPRQADTLMVAGTITYKMAPVLRQIHGQMCEPKWVVAIGACASSGGFYDNYCTLQGIDEIIPVDVYVAGCPPHPENILRSVIKLQEKIQSGVDFPRGAKVEL